MLLRLKLMPFTPDPFFCGFRLTVWQIDTDQASAANVKTGIQGYTDGILNEQEVGLAHRLWMPQDQHGPQGRRHRGGQSA
jgi:hypothetical protein